MEARFRYESNTAPFDETAHMARHRFGARGNALTFPLPWEEVLAALQEACEENEEAEEGDGPAAAKALPRSGKQLADVARIILKTNKDGQTTEEEIKTLIHQANVRREAPYKPKGFASYKRSIIVSYYMQARHRNVYARGCEGKPAGKMVCVLYSPDRWWSTSFLT